MPLILLALVVITSARDSLRQAAYERSDALAGMTADYIAQYLENAKGEIDEEANRSELQRALASRDTTAVQGALELTQSKHTEFDDIFIVADGGRTLYLSGGDHERSARSFVAHGQYDQTGNSVTVSPAYRDPTDGSPVLSLSIPLHGPNNQISGVMVGLLSISEFERSLEAIQDGREGLVTVVDQNGTIIADSNANMLMHAAGEEGPVVARMLRNGKGGVEETSIRGESVLLTYKPAVDSGWGILVQEPTAIALAGVNNLLWWSGGWLAVSLVLAILLATLFSRRLTNPLRRLQGVVVEAGQGNLDSRLQLTTGDEIQELAETFNGMAEQLRSKVDELAAALRQAEKERSKAETITAVAADGVVVVDEDRRVAMINPAFEKLIGYTGVELVGRPCEDVLGLQLADKAYLCEDACPFHQAVQERPSAVEARLQTKAGNPVWAAVTFGVIRDVDGQVKGVVHNIRDMSGQKEVQRLKDEFLGTISHELRTPLTAILGYGDMLLKGMRGPLTAKQEETQQFIRSNALRLLTLINDLLDVTRLESGEIVLSYRSLSVPVAVEKALSSVSILAAAKGVTLQRDLPATLPPVFADEDKLQQILYNLLANAIKFTPEVGIVSVEAQVRPVVDSEGPDAEPVQAAAAQVVELRVRDTGIGLAPDQLPRIWDRFYQVDSSPSRRFGGTGLGLAIVRHLVALHGGDVWAESDGLDQGSTFAFTLSVARDQPVGGQGPLPVAERKSVKGRTPSAS